MRGFLVVVVGEAFRARGAVSKLKRGRISDGTNCHGAGRGEAGRGIGIIFVVP